MVSRVPKGHPPEPRPLDMRIFRPIWEDFKHDFRGLHFGSSPPGNCSICLAQTENSRGGEGAQRFLLWTQFSFRKNPVFGGPEGTPGPPPGGIFLLILGGVPLEKILAGMAPGGVPPQGGVPRHY